MGYPELEYSMVFIWLKLNKDFSLRELPTYGGAINRGSTDITNSLKLVRL